MLARSERRDLILVGLAAALSLTSLGCSDEKPSDYYELPRFGPHSNPTVDVPRVPAPDVHTATPDVPDDVAPDVGDDSDVPDPVDASVPDTAAPDAGPVKLEPAERPLPTFVDLFRRLSPSVVNIYTQEVVERRLFDPLRDPAEGALGTALGSGMVLDEDGYILTNAHVVENAAEIRVRFADESELPARLVGIDPTRDLALLKVDGANDLVPVVPGDSASLRVGDWILAIGNPFGLSHTLTKGIVSAKGRAEFITRDSGYHDLIQTDAAINEGNSGGPLFNLDGEVVGVATAVSARGYGIGFAIPWNTVKQALPRLKQGGQVSRSWLGVYVRAPSTPTARGLLVVAVVSDSPAERAGIAPGDVMVAFGDRSVKDTGAFRLMVAASAPGEEVGIKLMRGGREFDVSARLEEARGLR